MRTSMRRLLLALVSMVAVATGTIVAAVPATASPTVLANVLNWDN